MDIKELKKENKELRSKLNKDDKNFMDAVSFYLDQFQLSSLERQEIMNQIYQDVMHKIEVNNSLWFIIEDPIVYCDRFLWGNEKKVKNIKVEWVMFILLFITMIAIYILMMNVSNEIPVMMQVKKGFVVTSGMVINSISLLLFSLVPVKMRVSNPFNKSHYSVKFFSAQSLSLFFALMMGGFAKNHILFNVDKPIVYGITIIGLAYLTIKRKLI